MESPGAALSPPAPAPAPGRPLPQRLLLSALPPLLQLGLSLLAGPGPGPALSALALCLALSRSLGGLHRPLLLYTACCGLSPALYRLLLPARARALGLGLGLAPRSLAALLLPHAASGLALALLEAAAAAALLRARARGSLPGTQRSIRRRLLALSRPDLVPLSGAFTFLTLAVIGEMFVPYYTGKVIDLLSSRYDHQAFLMAIFYMFLSSLGSSISAGLRGGLFMFTMCRLNKRVREQLFSSLVQQEIGFFEITRSGHIASRLSTDTMLMSRSVGLNVNVFLRSLVKTVGVLFFMVSLSWQLTLLIFIESPLTIVLQKLYNKYHMKLVQEVQDSIAKSNQVAGEVVSGIRTVRSFATENEESELFEEKLQATNQLKNRRDFVRAVYLVCLRHIQLVMQLIMLYAGQHLIRNGQMSSGNVVSFILYQMNFGVYIKTLVHIYSEMTHSVGAAEKVFEYMDRKSSVPTDGKLVKETLKGHVEFQNVSFSYPTRPDVQALKISKQDVSKEKFKLLLKSQFRNNKNLNEME
ncbi:antigen peptide transporter 2-like [Chiloscyllium plagiosum]|uniref:antigen peptide transporter 2-like n=1 Tax=Chiloscyllium plagiosum TaxID=36176 RepID=UPI001CB84974|nr:antigen peptide transporter 2-like [Chiloscyllium plagiosum]